MGIVNLCCTVSIQTSFTKHRNVAQSIALMGQGVGGILAGIFLIHIISNYGWRGAMALQGAMLLNLLVLSFGFHKEPSVLPSVHKQASKAISTSSFFPCIKNYLSDALNFEIFHNTIFVLFGMSKFFFMLTLLALIAHFPGCAVAIGLSREQGMLVYVGFSIGTLVGRVPLNAVASIRCINNILLIAAYEAVIGLIVILMGFTVSFKPLWVEGLVIGLFGGRLISNIVCLVVV